MSEIEWFMFIVFIGLLILFIEFAPEIRRFYKKHKRKLNIGFVIIFVILLVADILMHYMIDTAVTNNIDSLKAWVYLLDPIVALGSISTGCIIIDLYIKIYIKSK